MVMLKNGHEFYEGAMKKAKGSIIGARLGPMYVYLICGAANVQTIFRNSRALSSDFLVLEVYRKVINIPAADLKIFQNDNSGPGKDSFPGTEIPEEQRIWRHIHHAQAVNLQSKEGLEAIVRVFTREFLTVLEEDELEIGEWKELGMYEWFRTKMSTASTIALVGRRIFEYNPHTIADFWEYFAGFMSLFLGLPDFMNAKIVAARERSMDGFVRLLKSIEGEGKYEGIMKSEEEWDENLGSMFNRSGDKAMRECGVTLEGRGRLMAGSLIGINGNAIPTAAWLLLECIQDPALLSSLRNEILTAVTIVGGDIEVHMEKLAALPLLSSVFTEILRLRISTTPTRQLRNDLLVDGYLLKKGNTVMCPSHIAHITSTPWSSSPQPPDQFFAERFLNQKEPEAGTYFPFGGGSSKCPGRFFAKQEIYLAVAIIIAKYDFEFLGFSTFEGEKSERGPLPDIRNAGSGALVPDREVRCRMRRRF